MKVGSAVGSTTQARQCLPVSVSLEPLPREGPAPERALVETQPKGSSPGRDGDVDGLEAVSGPQKEGREGNALA